MAVYSVERWVCDPTTVGFILLSRLHVTADCSYTSDMLPLDARNRCNKQTSKLFKDPKIPVQDEQS